MRTVPPAGLTVRPLRADDAAAVVALTNACELADLGETLAEFDDVVADWHRPSFDLATDSVGVFDGPDLVGYAEVYRARRAEAYVRPERRGAGIGTWLAGWTREQARAAGGRLVGQTLPAGNTGAVGMFTALGYTPRWTTWVLALPRDAEPPTAPPPPGVTIREYEDGDGAAAYRTIEDAFGEWPDREPTTYGDWAAGVLERTGFAPWQVQLAVADGVVVGACHVIVSGDGVGWVNQLAVRRDHRGRGIARALLAAAFAATRAQGASGAELSTDSRTGALDLYLHLGMRVRQTFTHYAVEL
ncbi:GNAT family N-acetyltransferase [Actinocatenispora rupis]|uniref:N-acetyltransferase domain-containing protein n=1 Tax=Actinocatenispora rupis TaxID=519421 RepID=A0A8J3J3Q0_9ACTN|nr:GNAT family N-acetyltransferase [Actinocatenispora rupis]GID15251.1 hypothetical protein Aru02nite_61400 [Actinocatenispora rupis]